MDFKTFWCDLPVSERKAFAVKCGTTPGHLSNIAYGIKPAGESLAISIDRESGGKVRCEELRDDVDWAYLRNSTGTPSTNAKRARAGSAR
jgi:DNA-binding transcriptional regulator YdaS (Cro superfamily)